MRKRGDCPQKRQRRVLLFVRQKRLIGITGLPGCTAGRV